MSHLVVLGFDDSASAQAARTVMQQADPSQLTILDEDTLTQFAPKAASKTPALIPLLVRVPLAMCVGVLAGIYYGAKWFFQTMGAVSYFLAEPQTNTNAQAPYGRVVLLIDEALSETLVNKFKQLGASVRQVGLSAEEEARLRSYQPVEPELAQAAATAEAAATIG
jgi:uncharacterized membrane protein